MQRPYQCSLPPRGLEFPLLYTFFPVLGCLPHPDAAISSAVTISINKNIIASVPSRTSSNITDLKSSLVFLRRSSLILGTTPGELLLMLCCAQGSERPASSQVIFKGNEETVVGYVLNFVWSPIAVGDGRNPCPIRSKLFLPARFAFTSPQLSFFAPVLRARDDRQDFKVAAHI